MRKTEDGSEWVGDGRLRKAFKKSHTINQISTLRSPNKSLLNAMNDGIFYRNS